MSDHDDDDDGFGNDDGNGDDDGVKKTTEDAVLLQVRTMELQLQSVRRAWTQQREQLARDLARTVAAQSKILLTAVKEERHRRDETQPRATPARSFSRGAKK